MKLAYGKWFSYSKLLKEPKLFLIMFPHAGGNAMNYVSMQRHFNPDIQLLCVNLPGRDIRIKEPMYDSLQECAKQFVDENIEMLETLQVPYVIAGHSMGGILAYETAAYLEKKHYKKPEYLFLSGCTPPKAFQSEELADTKDKEAIVDYLKQAGGIEEDLYHLEEFWDYYFPIVILDFEICSQYKLVENEKLHIPLAILLGREDDMTDSTACARWKEYTNSSCTVKHFSGNHFFILNDMEKVCNYIKNSVL